MRQCVEITRNAWKSRPSLGMSLGEVRPFGDSSAAYSSGVPITIRSGEPVNLYANGLGAAYDVRARGNGDLRAIVAASSDLLKTSWWHQLAVNKSRVQGGLFNKKV